MADRDLRALDMRHTLPNLKNLLLTLTDGEGVSLRYVTESSYSLRYR
jgi:ABC-type antimicrobial peptide transport system ATPase subunit